MRKLLVAAFVLVAISAVVCGAVVIQQQTPQVTKAVVKKVVKEEALPAYYTVATKPKSIPDDEEDEAWYSAAQIEAEADGEDITDEYPIVNDADRPWRVLYLPAGWENDPKLVRLKNTLDNHGQPGNPFNTHYGRVRPHVIVQGEVWYEEHAPIHRNRLPCLAIIGARKVSTPQHPEPYLPVFFKISGSNFDKFGAYDMDKLAYLCAGKLVSVPDYGDQKEVKGRRRPLRRLVWRLFHPFQRPCNNPFNPHCPRPNPNPSPPPVPVVYPTPVDTPPYDDTVVDDSVTVDGPPWILIGVIAFVGVLLVGFIVGFGRRIHV